MYSHTGNQQIESGKGSQTSVDNESNEQQEQVGCQNDTHHCHLSDVKETGKDVDVNNGKTIYCRKPY